MSMLLRSSAQGFSVLEHDLAQRLAEQMMINVGHFPTAGERRSWERSLPVLASELISAGLGDVEMLLEYQLPLTSKRADVILAGVHPRTGRDSYVVVELKQWTQARLFEDDETLVQLDAYGARPVLHPVLQVRGYVDYLAGFNSVAAQNQESLHGLAYLHNATDKDVPGLFELPQNQQGRLFTGQRNSELRDYLRSVFAPAPGAEAAEKLLTAKVAPSKQLLAVAAEEVQKREQFVLLDEQRDAYQYVLHAVEKARKANTKTAVIVSGGPGSGKSVIALSLLGELARQERPTIHATGSKSFTTTLRKVAGHRAPRVRKMFQYFNSFMEAEPNDLDCLILDEAHRIRETSVNRFTKAALRTGRPQIDELLAAARVPVFLLDQNQVVRPGEMGTVDLIADFAHQQGIDVMRVELDAQFRCGGSKLYVDWVERLLGLQPGGAGAWGGDDGFEVRVAESPREMEFALEAHLAKGYSARIAAGFCWPWSEPRPDDTLVNDVVIGDWARPWNLKSERSIGGWPASSLWATEPAGFGQVGCIYTAQGFEYDYAGVIIGPDLVWRGDRWVADRSATKDPALQRRNQLTDQEFDALVRNVYKVLLTRGMRGVFMYSTDSETQEKLRELVQPQA